MIQNTPLRKIAIYLPQYHPIPENDEWWGKGFTEWTNVTKSLPRFNGHYQPHLPSDLGFYDLRLEEVRLAQEQLAKSYDIYGFCYYHYWFNGKRLLEEPLKRKLQNNKEDLPFMLCWANENWTRAWDGTEKAILIKQKYSEQDDRAHIKFLLPIFRDERYIKIDGKPVFIFYKPDLFPDMNRTIAIFREEASKAGIDLYLIWFERWIGWSQNDAAGVDFDACAEFQPLSYSFKEYLAFNRNNDSSSAKLVRRTKNIGSEFYKLFSGKSKPYTRKVDYKDFVEFDLKLPNKKENVFPGIAPMWDNSSRRINQPATVFTNSTPKLFKKWFEGKSSQYKTPSPEENLIFINAWNEWAEGNHLEPCQTWGTAYLDALK